jgi:hypothetical protein
VEPLDQPRREVDPALVHEEAALRVDDAVGGKTLRPPVEQPVGLLSTRQPEEA